MIDLFFFKGYPVAVMGLARSGLTAALALVASGAKVHAWDDSPARRASSATAVYSSGASRGETGTARSGA